MTRHYFVKWQVLFLWIKSRHMDAVLGLRHSAQQLFRLYIASTKTSSSQRYIWLGYTFQNEDVFVTKIHLIRVPSKASWSPRQDTFDKIYLWEQSTQIASSPVLSAKVIRFSQTCPEKCLNFKNMLSRLQLLLQSAHILSTLFREQGLSLIHIWRCRRRLRCRSRWSPYH